MASHELRNSIKEIIVVEGLHDKQAVDQAVKADVWVVGGDRVAKELFQELKRAALNRGVIILTDPDGPGERIRQRIAQAVPECRHAFVSQSEARSRDGRRVGIEFASPRSIASALAEARFSVSLRAQHPSADGSPAFTVEDLQAFGLVHHPQAAARRLKLGQTLRIGYANGRSFLHKLNALGVTREEWNQALLQVFPNEMRQIGKGKGSEQNDAADRF